MNANTPREPEASELPEPVIRSGKRQISIVWLVPVVAILIGGWLIYRTMAEKGPLVTITFRTAEGLEVGKTRVKYKSLDIGVVERLQFSDDFSRVEVRARLSKEAAHFLRRDSRFWVVKPHLGVRGISGLNTLISGSYIEIEPGEGAPQTLFAVEALDVVLEARSQRRSIADLLDQAEQLRLRDRLRLDLELAAGSHHEHLCHRQCPGRKRRKLRPHRQRFQRLDHQRGRHAHRERSRSGSQHHRAAAGPGGECRLQCDVHRQRRRHLAAELPMAL